MVDIKGYDAYQIDESGNVYSKISQRFLKPILEGPGKYFIVNMQNGSKQKTKRIHRLVALAFIPNPHNKPEVNHKDGDKANNSVENLEWATRKENEVHAQKYNLKEKQKAYAREKCILKNSKIVLNQENGVFYKSAKEAAMIFSMNHSTLKSRLNGTLKNSTNLKYV